MNQQDAEHAIELYKSIRHIDVQLEHLTTPHRFVAKIDAWASVSTGNYPIELEVPRRSPFYPMIRSALEGQLLHEREIRAGGLRKIGFDVPDATVSAHSEEARNG